jgi:hypothetical protein
MHFGLLAHAEEIFNQKSSSVDQMVPLESLVKPVAEDYGRTWKTQKFVGTSGLGVFAGISLWLLTPVDARDAWGTLVLKYNRLFDFPEPATRTSARHRGILRQESSAERGAKSGQQELKPHQN